MIDADYCCLIFITAALLSFTFSIKFSPPLTMRSRLSCRHREPRITFSAFTCPALLQGPVSRLFRTSILAQPHPGLYGQTHLEYLYRIRTPKVSKAFICFP